MYSNYRQYCPHSSFGAKLRIQFKLFVLITWRNKLSNCCKIIDNVELFNIFDILQRSVCTIKAITKPLWWFAVQPRLSLCLWEVFFDTTHKCLLLKDQTGTDSASRSASAVQVPSRCRFSPRWSANKSKPVREYNTPALHKGPLWTKSVIKLQQNRYFSFSSVWFWLTLY